MKNKRILSLLVLIIFFIVVWYLQGIPLIWSPSIKSLLLMNSSASGYNSIIAYALFYPLPFLFFLNHFFLPNNINLITKHKKRDTAFFIITLQIITASAIFSLIHFMVNIILTFLHYGWSIVHETNFLLICFINIFSILLFYSFLGLFNRFIKDIVRQYGLAIFLSFIIIGAYFFLDKLYIPGNYWSFFKELGVISYYYYEHWTLRDITYSFLKLFSLVIAMQLIGSYCFSRKDIFYNE
ncbi:WxPxxD family membrane protein [Bacillus massiliglaciei]|uniref:WxPxxD family membrane protein n=1 Tax=Bacillus massiliglaciei TaxID=1816693 RepID=UPI000DA62484